MDMSSSRPYLLRAIHEWLSDNGLTPQLVVNADHAGVSVPREYVKDGIIVLNVSHSAVRDLQLGNEYIMFSARFNGRLHEVTAPVGAILALQARENGIGMSFPSEEQAVTEESPPQPPGGGSPPAGGPTPAGGGKKPGLRVVK